MCKTTVLLVRCGSMMDDESTLDVAVEMCMRRHSQCSIFAGVSKDGTEYQVVTNDYVPDEYIGQSVIDWVDSWVCEDSSFQYLGHCMNLRQLADDILFVSLDE